MINVKSSQRQANDKQQYNHRYTTSLHRDVPQGAQSYGSKPSRYSNESHRSKYDDNWRDYPPHQYQPPSRSDRTDYWGDFHGRDNLSQSRYMSKHDGYPRPSVRPGYYTQQQPPRTQKSRSSSPPSRKQVVPEDPGLSIHVIDLKSLLPFYISPAQDNVQGMMQWWCGHTGWCLKTPSMMKDHYSAGWDAEYGPLSSTDKFTHFFSKVDVSHFGGHHQWTYYR